MPNLKSFIIILLLSFAVLTCKTQTNTTDTQDKIYFSGVAQFNEAKTKAQPVNDFSLLFSNEEQLGLSKILIDYHAQTTRQIVVVTVDSISPYNNSLRYATDLANYWGVGDAEKDNGLLFLICKPIRKVSIATGYGTEKILTDEICSSVINDIMVPKFANSQYFEGTKKGIEALIQQWE
jgi:uncharacterized protein